MEQSNIFNQFNVAYSFNRAPNYSLAGITISALLCPSDGLVAGGEPANPWAYGLDFGGMIPAANAGLRQAISSYAGNAGMWLVSHGPCGIDPGTLTGTGLADTDFP